MSDTPRTCALIEQILDRDGVVEEENAPFVWVRLSKSLERELNAAKAALSGRTVSCSNCNAMAEEIAAMKNLIRKIYYETETCADGAPDATDHDKLCNDISSQLEPYIK